MTRYVIVGDGGAGTTAAQTIRQRDRSAEIMIISDDPNPAYYRAALTNYLVGELNEAQLWAVPPSFYSKLKIERVFGRVVGLDTAAQRLSLQNGQSVPYDRLLIAAGSRAKRPPFAGGSLPGVMTMRTLRDVREVIDLVKLKQLKRAVIVGGGPLAMEWVVGLHERGVRVTYVLRGDHLMRRTLDRTASDLTLSRMKLAGVDVRTNEEVAEVLGDGRVTAVRLKSGAKIGCELVGVAIGVTCNTEWLAGSAVSLDATTQAVLTDDKMATTAAHIWAAGDVAQVGEHLLQLWEPARLQGRTAGVNMTGGEARFALGAHYNATRLYDLDFASVGDFREDNGVTALVDFPRTGKEIRYRKLFVRGGQLQGAILLGDRKLGVRQRGRLYKKLIDARLNITELMQSPFDELPPLLDPHFDLRSWIEHVVRPSENTLGAPKTVVNRNGEMRRTQAFKLPVQPDAPTRQAQAKATEALTAVGLPAPMKTMMRIGNDVEHPAYVIVAGKKIKLAQRQIAVGRAADVCDLVLNDAGVSHVHAHIVQDGRDWYVRDAGSRNGTYVGEKRVTVPHLLENGDELVLGESRLRFETAVPRRTKQVQSKPRPQKQAAVALACPHCAATIKKTTKFCPQCGRAVAEAEQVRPYLVVLDGAQKGRRAVLGDRAWVGRDFHCDLVLANGVISGRHLEIVKRNDSYWVRDWGSRNGSRLDGEPLGAIFVLWQPNDTISLADTVSIRLNTT